MQDKDGVGNSTDIENKFSFFISITGSGVMGSNIMGVVAYSRLTMLNGFMLPVSINVMERL